MAGIAIAPGSLWVVPSLDLISFSPMMKSRVWTDWQFFTFVVIAGYMMETLWRKVFLLTELHAFDTSTNKTSWQDYSLYIACITCRIDSLQASYPAKTCSDPADVILSVRICVTTTLPAIWVNTLPIPIGLSPGYLSIGTNRQAKNLSMDNDRFSSLKIFLMISANVSYRSAELLPSCFDVNNSF